MKTRILALAGGLLLLFGVGRIVHAQGGDQNKSCASTTKKSAKKSAKANHKVAAKAKDSASADKADSGAAGGASPSSTMRGSGGGHKTDSPGTEGGRKSAAPEPTPK